MLHVQWKYVNVINFNHNPVTIKKIQFATFVL
jgi:hypothetical protein